MTNLSRRRFFRGQFNNHTEAKNTPVYLPWVASTATFTIDCTRCEQCIASCPQSIVIKGDGGFPNIDFTVDECTFCGECAKACPEPLFNTQQPPWDWIARINDDCMTHQGIVCQSCRDVCAPKAIGFNRQMRGVSTPMINIESCTGCGACIAPCPSHSIQMAHRIQEP